MRICLPRSRAQVSHDTTEAPRTRKNFLCRRPARRGRPNLQSIPEISTMLEECVPPPRRTEEAPRPDTAESFPRRVSVDLRPGSPASSASSSLDQRSMILAEMAPCTRVFSRSSSQDQAHLFADFDESNVQSSRVASPFSPKFKRASGQSDYVPRLSTIRELDNRRLDTIESRMADLKYMHEREADELTTSIKIRDDEMSILRRLVNKTCENYDVLESAFKALQLEVIDLKQSLLAHVDVSPTAQI